MVVSLGAGSLFAGRYRVVRCIAAGGMGAVYEVVHLETERHRALKVMLPHIVHSAELRERFKREARVAAQIESEFIVDIFDAGVDEATQMPFMVMELLKGEELGKRVDRLGSIPAQEAVGYLHQVALALDKTHRANIVHRDLKPENLFLTEREDGAPRVKVLDFGIAKLLAEGGTHGATTRTVGTPLYMAPEQFKSGPITGACDIFALGMIAYTLLVGVPYWDEEASGDGNVFSFATTVMNGPTEPASVRARRRGVTLPAPFDAWFAVMTSTTPEDRFATASAATAALARLLGVPPPAVPKNAPRLEVVEEHVPVLAQVVPGAGTFSDATLSQALGIKPKGRRLGTLAGIALGVAALSAGGLALRHRMYTVAKAPWADPAAEPRASAASATVPSATPALRATPAPPVSATPAESATGQGPRVTPAAPVSAASRAGTARKPPKPPASAVAAGGVRPLAPVVAPTATAAPVAPAPPAEPPAPIYSRD